MAKFDELDKVAKEHGVGGGGNILRIREEGTWLLRLASEYEVLQKYGYSNGKRWVTFVGEKRGVDYPDTDKVNTEFWMYVFDRNDGNKLKLFAANWTIVSAIRDLAKDDDYKFGEDGLPGYDIKVTKKIEGPANQPSSHKYSVLPGRGDTPLTDDEKGDMVGIKPIAKVIEDMVAKDFERIKEGEYLDVSVKYVGEGNEGGSEAPAEAPAAAPEAAPEDIPFESGQ